MYLCGAWNKNVVSFHSKLISTKNTRKILEFSQSTTWVVRYEWHMQKIRICRFIFVEYSHRRTSLRFKLFETILNSHFQLPNLPVANSTNLSVSSLHCCLLCININYANCAFGHVILGARVLVISWFECICKIFHMRLAGTANLLIAALIILRAAYYWLVGANHFLRWQCPHPAIPA